MNKAQDYIEKVKRHQFWILCGMVSVIAIISWWLATSSLAKTYAANKSKIDSEAGKIQTVAGINPHPNEKSSEVLLEQVKGERKEVEKAWQRLYSEQKSKVYLWPADTLGQDFVDSVQNLRPGEELPNVFLGRYWTEVLKEFKKLADLVDAEYLDPRQAAGAFSERGSTFAAQPLPGQSTHKVIWNGQTELQQPYIWEKPPTTLQVKYTQEEIWVIKAICEAIALANKDSTGAHDAAVRTIESLTVAFDAAEELPNGMKDPSRITKVKMPVAGASGYGSSGGYGSSSGAPSTGEGGAPTSGAGLVRPARPDRASSGRGGYGGLGGSSESSSAATTSTNPEEYLNNWRYVDANSKPLTAADLANPPFYEYRLMPWRVRMTVDQRQWDDLLVCFRNTDLPLEIRQVRVNAMDAGTSFGGRGGEGGSRGGYGSSGGGGYGSSRGGYGSSEGRGGRGGPSFGASAEATSDTVTLELRGVAYLINPPDPEKIGKAGTQSSPADFAPAPAAPAAAPPPENGFGAMPPTPATAASPAVGTGYGSGR